MSQPNDRAALREVASQREHRAQPVTAASKDPETTRWVRGGHDVALERTSDLLNSRPKIPAGSANVYYVALQTKAAGTLCWAAPIASRNPPASVTPWRSRARSVATARATRRADGSAREGG